MTLSLFEVFRHPFDEAKDGSGKCPCIHRYWIAEDRIREIRWGRDGMVVELEGEIVYCDHDNLVESGHTIIPAQAGFFLLECWYEEDGKKKGGYTAEPVIAWRIFKERIFSPIPVTVDEHSGSNGVYAILQPDGRVIEAGNGSWDSARDWWEDELKEQKVSAVNAKRERDASEN
jgi:hypothetical protein